MLYVYRRAASTGARELADALQVNARRLDDLGRAHFGKGVRAGDIVVCWGERLAPIQGVRILNGAPIQNKLEDAVQLRAAGVPTVEVSQTRPVPTQQPTPVDPLPAACEQLREKINEFRGGFWTRGPVFRDTIQEIQQELAQVLTLNATPAPTAPPPQVVGEWLPRTLNHTGGLDLLRPGNAEFFAKKENFTEEFRVHNFNGRSIRAGRKAPRAGVRQHPWIRSYDGGWFIDYDGFESTRQMRELAGHAVQALGLQFGAVDIGRRQDGTILVLEVNRAPGLENNTVTSYARAIEGWIGEQR